jgi:hypothetical protein
MFFSRIGTLLKIHQHNFGILLNVFILRSHHGKYAAAIQQEF